MIVNQIIAFDKKLSQELARWANGRYLRPIAWTLARTGDSWLWLLIIAVLLWQRQVLGWDLLVAVLTTAAIVYVCKIIFRRERPSESRLAIAGDKYAFPSGHAARSGAVAVALALAFPQITLGWLAWAILVSIARVALSRHYLTDVFGGLLLGILVGASLQIII
jgi:undecaprenyl-diphosphatase